MVPARATGCLAGGSDVEERSAVDIVWHESRWAPADPQRFGDRGDLGEDLRGGVPSSDDHDPLAGEHVGRVVADGVQLPAGERVLTGDVRQVGALPRAGGTDHRSGLQRACVRLHDPTLVLPADAGDADRPAHRQLVALLVSFEVVHDVACGGERLAGLGGHRPSGQRTVLGWGEHPERLPAVLPGPTRSFLFVEDDEVQACAAEEVSGGESGLASSDDDDVTHASAGSWPSSSEVSVSIRDLISSRIGRTASMPWPAGSSSFQSS